MKILVVTKGKTNDEMHHKTVKTVEDFLNSKKVDYILKPRIELKQKHFKEKDLIIAVGGDGTFLEAASYIFNDTKILGVKSTPNSVGAHCTADFNDVTKKLERILNNDYAILKCTRLEAILDDKLIKDIASNEIFVGNKYTQGGSKYILTFGKQKEKQLSSGIVCAVGMGSSGWYSNIHGKIGDTFSWDSNCAKFVVREGQKDGQYACKIIPKGVLSENGYLMAESLMYKNGIIAFDGSTEDDRKRRVYEFNMGAIAKIRISDKPLSVVYFNKL